MSRRENALTLRRKPTTNEFFNLGKQPSIPTRGLSSILIRKQAISLLREELL